MIGIGTLTNVVLVIVGGLIGLLLGSRINSRIQETLLIVVGLSVCLMALGGVLSNMLVISNGTLATTGVLMMILCLAAGTVVGEILKIDSSITRLGAWLQVKAKSTDDNSFIQAFVSTSTTVTIGAMAVLGAIQDGLGQPETLITKGIIDGIFVCIMAAAQGKGAIFSALPVGIFQGLIMLIAAVAGNFVPSPALNNLSYVGNALILVVGLTVMGVTIKGKPIRVANMLPAIVFAMAWGWIAG